MFLFQFTQPKRAATVYVQPLRKASAVSIHAAQAGCDKFVYITDQARKVSIHAAQAGCDIYLIIRVLERACFNSRSPSGLRHPAGPHTSFVATFQFTQPKRAATSEACNFYLRLWFQFTQPKRAATDALMLSFLHA